MQSKDKQYTYYAFISYKHEDEKWAKRLQNKLESYGFSVALRKDNPELPKKIQPIFRDQTDLTGGKLKDAIEDALRESQYLIVICSPRAAQSPWVSKEVQYFIDNKRENNIIPFIIGGTPNSINPENECFPEGLRQLSDEKEILAININDMGREAASIKVIARMFGLRFDTLWQRHERAKHRKRVGWGLIAGAIIIATLSVAVFIHGKNLQLELANKTITAERNRADEQTAMVLRANKSLEIANDSIKRQSYIITQANKNLEESNRQLAEERDNVLKANWKIMENRARAVAEKANQLIDEGDSYTARLLCLEVLPKDLKNPEIPYVPEAERALRKSYINPKGKIVTHDWLKTMAVCAKMNTIVIGNNSKMYIYDYNTLGLRYSIDTNSSISSIDYNPTTNFLISAGRNLKIWDTESWKCLRTIDSSYSICKQNPNGSFFVAGGLDGFDIYDSNSLQCVKSYRGEEYRMKECVFSPNGRFLVYSYNLSVEISILDTKTWQLIPSLKGHKATINAISFSPDGEYLISGSYDKSIKIWKTDSWECVKTFTGHNASITSVIPANQWGYNYIISGGKDAIIKIWDFDTGICIDSIKEHSKPITSLQYDYEKGLMSASYDGSFIVHGHNWGHVKDFDHISIGNDSHKNMIYSMKLSPNGKYLASGSYDKTIKIWDMATFNCIATLKGHTSSVYSLSFSPDSKYLVSSSEEILIWDTSSWKCIKNIGIEGAYKITIAYSPDGKYLYSTNCFRDGKRWGKSVLREWDASTFKETKTKEIPNIGGNTLALSPNGKLLITGSDTYKGEGGCLYLWDLASFKCLYHYRGHESRINTIAFSPNGKYYVTGSSDKTFKLWDINKRQCIKTFNDEIASILFVAFSPDGNYLATGSSDGWNKIWDIKSGVCMYSICTNIEARSLVFGTDIVFYYGGWGRINVFPFFNLQHLIDTTRTGFTNRQLTPVERHKYYLE